MSRLLGSGVDKITVNFHHSERFQIVYQFLTKSKKEGRKENWNKINIRGSGQQLPRADISSLFYLVLRSNIGHFPFIGSG